MSVDYSQLPDEPRSKSATATWKGHIFDILDPATWRFDIEEIARSLSNNVRYNGHTDRPLTIAEHSINVMMWLSNKDYNYHVQLLGLMHEVAEAYVGDIPGPWKPLVSVDGRPIKEIEEDIEVAFFDEIGMAEAYIRHWHLIKEADIAVYLLERDSRPDPSNGKFSHDDWYQFFLASYETLSREVAKEKNELIRLELSQPEYTD